MDVRGKVVELLDDIQHYGTVCTISQMDDRYARITQVSNTEVAERLITRGVTVQEWISVKDRLPDEAGRYLTLKKRIAPEALGGNRTDIVILRFFEDSGFKMPKHIPNWINEEINDKVTHWMPLPQPPKGK